ncbi:MAG: T9SS type A sorting domain-containing protein, partial [Bacteroidales bacterium]|nr:T9SS type A sorting domain-containing protein [Bacteroidales bacterium]
DQIIVFPDFAPRTQDNIVYFDNITFNAAGDDPDGPTVAAPTPPALDPANVLSVFSDAYSDVAGTNFNPGWGQTTQVSFVEIAGNETMKYASFNYQGTEFASALNVTQMETLHLDMWTADATSVNIFLISPGPVETAFALPITPNQWVSYDIPLTAFTGVNLADVIQFKFDGGNGSQTLYLDNLYFYKEGSVTEGPRNPIDFEDGGYGADWTWTVFENASNPALEIISNPDPSGNNTSATVAKFTALQAGNPWAGVESAHGDTDLGTFLLDETNSIIKIMVWKPVISDVGIKLATASGWAQPELKVANTVINAWEELTFDFSGVPNNPGGEMYDQIIVFPDFAPRTQDNIVYFDNITFNAAGEEGTDASLSDLQVDGTTVAGFSPTVLNYSVVLPEGTTVVPTVTATTNDPEASAVITPAGAIPGTTSILVTSANTQVERTYTVAFSIETGVVDGPRNPIDFEPGGYGADWTWTVFENETNPPLEIIANPDPSGINTSATVAKFTALQEGNPWAGVESQQGVDLGTFEWNDDNRTVKIHVWKPVISDVGIKFATETGWAQVELKVSNTVTNAWEELTFDFSNYINPPDGNGTLGQIIIFPDFDLDGREQDNIVYFDNITFSAGGGVVTPDEPTVAAPTPTIDAANVISLFSDAYTDVPVDTWRTNWSVADYEEVTIDGNPTKKYTNLDFVGIETVANQIDITGMTHFHVHVWSPNATLFRVKLVDFGADAAYGGGDDTEHEVPFPDLTQGEWVSLNIPLTDFANLAGRQNIAQLIFSGQPTGALTVYIDNVLFYSDGTSVNEIDAVQNQVRVYPNPVRSGETVMLNAQVKQVDVFDISGRMILSSTSNEINTAGMNRGVYFVRIHTLNGGLQTQKLIVN